MPTPTQPPQDLLGAPMPRLEEYQKTAINMFTELKIDPERIVKAIRLMDNGVQGLLDETNRMVLVADAYLKLFGIDNAALVQFQRTYGPEVLRTQIHALVQISQQGLLPTKQDGGASPRLLTHPCPQLIPLQGTKRPRPKQPQTTITLLPLRALQGRSQRFHLRLGARG